MPKAHHELVPPRLRAAAALLSVVALLSACGDRAADEAHSGSRGWEDLPALEIVRVDQATGETEPPSGPLIDDKGMTSIVVDVPPTFLSSHDSEASSGSRKPNQFATEILERAGVEFSPGAYARYDVGVSKLTVYNTPDQVDLVAAYTQSIGEGPRRLLTCRVEIYEMPTQAAVELQRISAQKVFHEAEREAVIAACRRGDATFVTGVDLPALSGQRTRFESGREYPLVSAFLPPAEAASEPDRPNSLFEWKRSGLVLEIDPMTLSDSFTFNVNLQLSFEISPPVSDALHLISDRQSRAEAPLTVSVKRLSHLNMQTEVVLFDGLPCLIGVLPLPPTPTSKQHAANAYRSQVVFFQLFVRSR